MRYSIPVVIHADPNHLIFIDDVGHIPIHEVCMKHTLELVYHEHLHLLAYDAYLLIIVHDVKISCFLHITEIEVKYSFKVWIPKIGIRLTKRSAGMGCRGRCLRLEKGYNARR